MEDIVEKLPNQIIVNSDLFSNENDPVKKILYMFILEHEFFLEIISDYWDNIYDEQVLTIRNSPDNWEWNHINDLAEIKRANIALKVIIRDLANIENAHVWRDLSVTIYISLFEKNHVFFKQLLKRDLNAMLIFIDAILETSKRQNLTNHVKVEMLRSIFLLIKSDYLN